MAGNSPAGQTLLDELTQTLTASGWTRTDPDHFAIATPQFTHPGTPAVLTITMTGTPWTGPSAYLMHDDTDNCWRVACDNPNPAVLAAAANATLPSDNPNRHRPLKQLLHEAGWGSEHQPGGTSRARESRWTSPDGTRVVYFPDSGSSPPAWMIHDAVTFASNRIAQYAPTPATPTAVLAALALTPAATDPDQTGGPDATD